jgi:hypothetical protein
MSTGERQKLPLTVLISVEIVCQHHHSLAGTSSSPAGISSDTLARFV